MEEQGKCLALYSRKSRFTGRGESIENQVALCRDYVARVYGEDAAGQLLVYEDEGFSGGNTQRPALRRMMRDARAGRLRAIVVYRLDRISRNIGDFSRLIEELAGLHIEFVSIREQFDTGSPMGRAMMYIASVFSQLERETIAERIRDNMHELAKTGRWLGGVTPTGYTSESVQRVTLDGRVRRVCRLTPIPEEAALVREIFSLFACTGSLSAVEAELQRRRVKTRNGRSFTRYSVKAILQNPVYLIADRAAYRYFVGKGSELCAAEAEFDGVHGLLAYNRTDQHKRGAARFLPETEWLVSVGGHEGLIPSALWIAVQQSLEKNRDKGFRRPGKSKALLGGLLFCACGSRMTPRSGGRRYACAAKRRSRKTLCAVSNADGAALEAGLLAALGQLPEDTGLLLQCLEKGRRRLQRLRAPEALPPNEAETGLDACRNGETASLSPEACESLARRLAAFSACLADMGFARRRAAVESLVSRVVWDGAGAAVWLRGDACHRCEDSK